MKSQDATVRYARGLRATLCAVLLLNHHVSTRANNTWATGRPPKSHKLAMMSPGGRNRPNYDMRAIKKEAEEKIARIEAEKEKNKAEAARLKDEADAGANEEASTAEPGAQIASGASIAPSTHSEHLHLEKGTPRGLAITLGKAAVIAGVGLLSAKKILTFTKAFIKRRRGDTEGSVIAASTAAGEEKDEKSDVDKEASEAAVHAQVADEVGGSSVQDTQDEAVHQESPEEEDGYAALEDDEDDGKDHASDEVVADKCNTVRVGADNEDRSVDDGGGGDTESCESSEGVDNSADISERSHVGQAGLVEGTTKVDTSYV